MSGEIDPKCLRWGVVMGEPLQVHTARLGIRDPDYLDVSLQGNMRRCESGGEPHRGVGIFFAPSPDLLYPYLSKRRHGRLTDADWRRYVADYTAEMRESYRTRRLAWDAVLSWPRVVLLCFCTDATHCHRRLLASILEKLGAVDCGEIAPAPARSARRSEVA
jgi:hypothetical protein